MATPTVFNVTLTNANTEYSYTLPANTRKLVFRCRGAAADVRYAWDTGYVAGPTSPYEVLPAGSEFVMDGVIANETIYFASATAGVVVEGEAWS